MIVTGGHSGIIRGYSVTGNLKIDGFGKNSEQAKRETDGKCHITCMQISNDKATLTVGASVTARHYSVDRPEVVVQCLEGHEGNITSLGFDHHDKWLFTTSEDRSIKIWDFRAQGFQMSSSAPNPILCGALHANGSEILAGSFCGQILTWDLSADRLRHENVKQNCASHLSTVVYADHLVACSFDGSAFVLDSDSLDDSGSLEGESLRPYSPSLDEDESEWVLSKVHEQYILSCSRVTDGILTSGADGKVTISRFLKGGRLECVRSFQNSSSWTWGAKQFKDERNIATCASDGIVRVWDDSGTLNFQVQADPRPLTALVLVE